MRLACLLISLLLIAYERAESPLPAASVEPAQHVLRNAYIYTVDPARSIASAMAIRDGRIVYLGNENGVNRYVGVHTQVNDLKGRLVLPGFIQSISNNTDYSGLDLSLFQSVEAYQNKIQDYILNNPEAQIVVGRGWKMEVFGDDEPHKAMLDQINDLVPIIMFSADHSYVWTNSEAIAAAGIDMSTNSSTENFIKRSDDGIPIGLFQGRGAVSVFSSLIPEDKVSKEFHNLSELKDVALSMGVTTLHSFHIPFFESENKAEKFKKSNSLENRDVRIRAFLTVPMNMPSDRFISLRNYADKISSDDFKVIAISFVIPDSISNYNYLIQDELGESVKDTSAWLVDLFHQANLYKFQVHFSLPEGSYESGILRGQVEKLINAEYQGVRNIVSNIPEFLLVDLLEKNNAAAIVYEGKLPTFNVDKLTEGTGSYMGDKILFFAGDGKLEGQMNSLNVIRDPISIIHTGAKHKVPVDLMIRLLTIRGAYAIHLENEVGSLEVGKWADFIVLDGNLLKIKSAEIDKVRVLNTYYKGRQVY
ncbi:amidohydrolase family protein [Microbulbifer sp. JTAC008]|uniref:amidohydrolase family protein n=1 Tax=unclassified Microbulbifer TaxID=2619833 RepID=UPI004038FD0D